MHGQTLRSTTDEVAASRMRAENASSPDGDLDVTKLNLVTVTSASGANWQPSCWQRALLPTTTTIVIPLFAGASCASF